MKILLQLLAWISFVIGMIGIFLPILPTTPFLILSAFLFSKSSPRFHTWLMNLPGAGEGIRDWQQNRIIRPKAKILCALTIVISCIIIWLNARIFLAVKIGVSVLLFSVGIFVLTRRSSPVPDQSPLK